MSEFVFMLTHHDRTVANALEVWRAVEGTSVRYAGFKDIGIDDEARKRLVDAVHSSGRPVMLEVVSESRDAELRAAESALSLGVDYLLGGTRVDDIASVIAQTGIKYFPFAGRVTGHPSTLEGTVDEITEAGRRLVEIDAVTGLDLLAYRHVHEPEAVISSVLDAVDAPVIVAGSVSSVERIQRISQLGAWAFTVGSAVFEGEFGRPESTIRERIENVLKAAS